MTKMFHRRVNPNMQFINHVMEISDRVDAIENQPAGDIVIRETLSTTDSNGVKAVIGKLPDGEVGFEPFLFDITPPPVPTVPIVKDEPGTFVISWDGVLQGTIPRDFLRVNVIGYKMSGTSTVLTKLCGTITTPLDFRFVTTDVAAVGETWQFAFESEDYNGNLSTAGPRTASFVMQSYITDDGINAALTDIQQDTADALSAASAAQTAASDAQTTANNAATAAATAGNLVAAKSTVLIQSTTPTTAQELATTYWIDTTGGNNTPKRWSGSAWVAVTDKAAIDAAAAAVVAKDRADQAFANAATAATAAGTAQTTADNKNRVWYQATAPTGILHKQNDIWFNTAADNRISQWNATANTWDQQLIGNSAIIANLDAGKITVGTLLAAVIGAKSVTMDKLVITSTDNLVVAADFSIPASWGIITATTKTINATGGRGGGPSFRVTATSILQTLNNLNNKVTVGSDDRFRGSFYVRSTAALAAGAIKLNLRCFTTATASTNITIASSPLLVANTYTLVTGISAALPAGTIAVEFYLEVLNNNTATVTDIDYVAVTRAADGSLIVDGALDAKTITGPLIQTDNTPIDTSASRGVKWTTAGIKAYNVLGQKTFDLVASTGDLAVTGTFSSGTAPGTDADVGQTIRVQMGILNFQNWQNVPGLTFQKFDSGTSTTTPSGFIFYYFQGFLMRSTVPSTVWVAFKNESYLWIAQDAVHISGNNTGKANYGTAADRYTRAGISASATPNGVTGLNQNDSYARMHVTAVIEGDNVNEHYQSGLQSLGGPGYGATKGFTQIYHGKFNTTTATYQFTSVLTISNSNFSMATKAVNGTMDQAYIRTLDYNGGGGNWLQMAGDIVKIYGGFGSAAATGTALADKGSMQINADGSMLVSPAAVSGVVETDRATITAEGQGSFLLAPRNTPGGSRNYVWATKDNVGISGTLQINGENNIKHHRAEFANFFDIAGGNASWDTGPVVADTDVNRTKNNDFCVPGDTNGSIKFTRAGYYAIQLMFIPTGNPGSGWVKLHHSDGTLIGMDKVTEGQKHEAHITTVPIYFAVNQFVRSQTALSLASGANTRWRIVRDTLNI